MKRVIQKNTLSFSTSKSMQFLRTPKDIWESLSKEFQFTLDACASDKNYLLPKYYTKETDCLKQDWTGEVVYLHPLFDMHIGKFVKKAFNSKCTTVMLLPSSTHTRYFHKFIYHNPNAEFRFLEKPKQGFNFGNDDGTIAEIPKGKVGYIKPLMIVIFRNNGEPTKICKIIDNWAKEQVTKPSILTYDLEDLKKQLIVNNIMNIRLINNNRTEEKT